MWRKSRVKAETVLRLFRLSQLQIYIKYQIMEWDMIDRLHIAMIELYRGDARRIQHFCKVHSYAKLIAEMEQVDADTLFVIEAAALTHDIGIHICEEKYGNCNGKLQ